MRKLAEFGAECREILPSLGGSDLEGFSRNHFAVVQADCLCCFCNDGDVEVSVRFKKSLYPPTSARQNALHFVLRNQKIIEPSADVVSESYPNP